MPVSEKILADLREKYESGEVVVVVGSGLSIAGGLSSWQQLATELLRLVPAAAGESVRQEIVQLIDADNRLNAFSALSQALSVVEYNRAVEKGLDESEKSPPPVAEAIAMLAPKLSGVVTTNLDRFLERAFKGQWPHHVDNPPADLATRRRFIFKLAGTLEDRNTWVMTREQYEAVTHKDPLRKQVWKAIFQTRTLLFVGYDPSDYDSEPTFAEMRALAGENPPVHYALLRRLKEPSLSDRLSRAGLRLLEYDDEQEIVTVLRSLVEKTSAHVSPTVLNSATSAADDEALIEARWKDPADASLAVLAEEISKTLAPRCWWNEGSPLNGVSDLSLQRLLSGVLVKCAAVKKLPPFSILRRLRQGVTTDVMADAKNTNADAAQWASLLVKYSAKEADGLNLLAAILIELTPEDAAAREFDTLVQKSNLLRFSESQIRGVIRRATEDGARKSHALNLFRSICPALLPKGSVEIDREVLIGRTIRQLAAERGSSRFETFDRQLQEPPAAMAPAAPPRRHHIVLCLKPAGDGLYRPQVWCVQGEGPVMQYGQSQEPKTLPEVQTYLMEEYARLLEEWECLPKDVMLEFILPDELMFTPVDQWKLKRAKMQVAAAALGPVVVRSWDRLYESDYRETWPQWRQKWEQFHQNPVLEWLKAEDHKDVQSAFERLVQDTVCFVGLSEPPTAARSGPGLSGVLLCVTAAVPVLLWFRDTQHGVAQGKTLVEPHLTTDTCKTLPEWLRQRRAAAVDAMASVDDHACGKSLILLWDDPTRIPGDADPKIRRENIARRTL